MKIALCLHGISYGHNDYGHPVDFLIAYNNYKHKLFANNDVDIFYHTWNSGKKKEIHSIYKPKAYAVEDVKIFHKDISTKRNH